MKLQIIIPYRLYISSLVNYHDLDDDNTYKFNRSECSGFFTISNSQKCNKKSFNEIRNIANIYDNYLFKYKYDSSYDHYLIITVTCTSDRTHEIKSTEVSFAEMKRLRKEILVSSIIEEINKYLFLIVLKTSNTISILTGYALYPKNKTTETPKIISRAYMEKYKEDLKYPFDLIKAWEYINKKSLFVNGYSKTNIARAISILSLIFFEENSDVSNMALALTAIEALYARGNSGISSQLVDKIGVFLGTSLVRSKEINQLYNIRSRYIHGDINLYIAFCSHDTYIDKDLEIYDAFNYGLAILFETLKKIITEDKDELDFIYSIK